MRGPRKLRAYMAYDRFSGADEGAMLVFAENAQKARVASFGHDWHWGEGWTNWTAKWIRNIPEHLAKLDTGEPQVISNPPTCPVCRLWGGHKTPRGTCSLCDHEATLLDNQVAGA